MRRAETPDRDSGQRLRTETPDRDSERTAASGFQATGCSNLPDAAGLSRSDVEHLRHQVLAQTVRIRHAGTQKRAEV